MIFRFLRRPSAIMDCSKVCTLKWSGVEVRHYAKLCQNPSRLQRWAFIVRYLICWPSTVFIFKIQTFNGRYSAEPHFASLCQILWKSVKPLLRYDKFYFFSRLRPCAILDLWGSCFDDLRRAFVSQYCYAKFGGIDAVFFII